VFSAGITGTLNYYISGYDMMGGTGVSLELAVNSALVANTNSTTTYASGTTAVSAGQPVVLTFTGSSMSYSSFQIWMS
jgi:hypothetical protein